MTNTLAGKRILNTRAVHQSAALSDLLATHGAVPLEYPCIAIMPPDDTTDLDKALLDLNAGGYDWLVLTSTNTVAALAERLRVLNIKLSHSTFQTAVIGPTTATSVHAELGLQTFELPDEYVAESLATHIPNQLAAKVLLPISAIARPTLADMLTARGASVTVITAYQTIRGSGGVNAPQLLEQKHIDAITFTSSSTVTYLLERIDQEGGKRNDALSLPTVCIGHKTVATAREAGFTSVYAAHNHTLDGLVNELAAYFARQTKMRETHDYTRK